MKHINKQLEDILKLNRRQVMNLQYVYKVLARIYDLLDVIYFADHNKSPRKVVNNAIDKKDKVLDICTGTGTNAIRIAKNKPNAKVAGIDISKDMLRIAKNKVEKEEIDNIKFYCMDASRLKFKDEMFDKISIALVLHEMEDDMAKKLIQEAKRVLKQNGQIIVTEWEPERKAYKKLLFLPIHLLEPKTYRKFIQKDMKQYFEKFDLRIVEIVPCDYSKVIILEKAKHF